LSALAGFVAPRILAWRQAPLAQPATA
jgi:hypothetical protein